MGARQITGGQINAILHAVRFQTDDGNLQLSLLSFALIVACKSTGVGKEKMIEEIAKAFDRTRMTELVPLAAAPRSKLQ